ncbi:ABC transporter ATP-binding protein [Lactococcus lactis subsp. lactis]|uniref:ABC transporter ATP-binding protein n=1 Tax=Lactococcus lactis TaxID=1358 RepID=UPI00071CB49B|nr:ABC transporter ATP-binding protein [Lactococcus lactis]MDT3325455.1 ABC transporter ATP-binding protein/permease [Bacillota bacterium]KST79963.1 Lipid A export ATP-binding/permease protein MsbA [Lactococcus lactis subsp. lactis]MBR8678677.1 ATP-binding cassette domain-containing protein [Lactococcus lactis subsp. lactis]MBR8680896.1 ATP-binding cassette domain-containing protein [Lactococcus lactis subsp. lactis]MBR8686021.1 ATP-binding cassette domain-containing protein [Lactococcus lacti
MEKSTDKMSVRESWQVFKFIFKFLLPFKKYFVWAFVFSVITTALASLMPFVLSVFMDSYLTPMKATDQIIFYFAGLYLILAIINSIAFFFKWNYLQNGSIFVNQYIRKKVYRKIHQLGMRYFDQKPTGWLITRITNDTDLFDFWQTLFNALTSLLSIIIAFIALFIIDYQIALVMLLILPLLILAVLIYQKVSTKVYQAMLAKRSELNTKLNEYISGMRIIQQFRQESRLGNEFEKTNDEYYGYRKRVIQINGILLSPLVNFLMAISIVVVLLMYSNRSLHAVVEAGLIYAFISNVQIYFNPISGLMDSLSNFSNGLVASSRIKTIMEEKEFAPQQGISTSVIKNVDEKFTDRKSVSNSPIIQEGKIEFRNVSFSYDGEHQVLKNISFIVNPGETLAFVGHTGSGKSSIINVFMRFYEFTEGQVLIDDQDIRSYSKEELRKKIGLVLQDSFMFVASVTDNIKMMNPQITDQAAKEAARFVQADKFIKDLENGYETKVIEGGAAFSAGERQLINFARTIVRNPKILLLDEATANIDTETEALIQEGLTNMRQNRTTMAIAHRLSTIKDADQILVLNKGEIIERGNHDQLLELNGYYADMYRIQTLQKEL